MADPRLGSGPRRVALFALVLFFFGALSWLFALRLENGDFLPAYSSLRKDPMGTAVLYESLLRSGLKVQRNHDPLSRTVLHPNETLLIIGHHSTFFGMFRAETEQQALTSFVEQGGRLVITSTEASSSDAGEEVEEPDDTEHKPDDQKQPEENNAEKIGQAQGNKKDEQPEEEDADEEPDPPPWAVATKALDTKEKKEDKIPSIATGVLEETELSLAWPNSVVFKEPDEHWQVLLRLDNEPVLIKRQLGQGSIVLATSSFFLSNEAMLRDREVALLAWLTGSPSRLIFDEFHHGLRSRESIAGLIRTHNLHGVIIILVLLALLFVWKNSSSLLPRSKNQEKPAHHRTGRDQFEGMVNTLRLHPPKNLVATALQQWEKSNRRWCQAHPKQLDKMRQTVQKYTQEAREQGATPHRAPKNPKNSSRERQQVTCYQSISRILHEKNKSKPTQE
ncbi:DUF4350 domain-containing protein [Candidatus Electrothrix sp.]|uniref:DUF4350 domain-containing protein n=1 Tax=Candidatus Electrothrix sp. TaxID=2170559 RepID=UPI004057906D